MRALKMLAVFALLLAAGELFEDKSPFLVAFAVTVAVAIYLAKRPARHVTRVAPAVARRARQAETTRPLRQSHPDAPGHAQPRAPGWGYTELGPRDPRDH